MIILDLRLKQEKTDRLAGKYDQGKGKGNGKRTPASFNMHNKSIGCRRFVWATVVQASVGEKLREKCLWMRTCTRRWLAIDVLGQETSIAYDCLLLLF